MAVKLAALNDLCYAVRKIRKLSPNTGNGEAFRQGMQDMSSETMLEFCQAIDTAILAVNEVERGTVEVIK